MTSVLPIHGFGGITITPIFNFDVNNAIIYNELLLFFVFKPEIDEEIKKFEKEIPIRNYTYRYPLGVTRTISVPIYNINGISTYDNNLNIKRFIECVNIMLSGAPAYEYDNANILGTIYPTFRIATNTTYDQQVFNWSSDMYLDSGILFKALRKNVFIGEVIEELKFTSVRTNPIFNDLFNGKYLTDSNGDYFVDSFGNKLIG